MGDVELYDNGKSCILIRKDRLYIKGKCADYNKALTVNILSGLQVELGRNIEEIKNAFKATRLPVMFKEILKKKDMEVYNIVRIKTGTVDSRTVAIVICNTGIIKSISFNNDLLIDEVYKKYNRLSSIHQIALSCNIDSKVEYTRKKQVNKILSEVNKCKMDLDVSESKLELFAITKDTESIVYSFLKDKEKEVFKLMSVSIK
jgi:hypothetical protein